MHIVFYEKPGCSGNAGQKAWLQAAGHTLEVRDLLHWAWTREELLGFLGVLPVAQWFNRAAPRVKSGEVVPEAMDRETALQTLLDEHLLIRRPLLRREDGGCLVGFEAGPLAEFLAQASVAAAPGEGCAARTMTPCPDPHDELSHG
jgi:nitrogenase-associated protein